MGNLKLIEYIVSGEILIMDKDLKIKEAKELLENEGYIIIMPSKIQLEDSRECEECGFEGDCFSCACSICLMQQ